MDSIEIPSGRLVLVDPEPYPDATVVVNLAPGLYQVQVKLMDYEADRRVARLRVTNAPDPVLAEPLGDVSVDFALFGLIDDEEMRKVREYSLDEIAQFWDSLDPSALYGVLLWDPAQGIEMPYVLAGYGEGRYTVRKLRCGGRLVGVEVDFREDIDFGSKI